MTIFTQYEYQRYLKENPLPVGFIVVSGEQGAGKTSLVTALLSLDYKYWCAMRIKRAQARVNALNKAGYSLALPPHLYFSSIELSLNKPLSHKNAVRTHCLSVSQLGLPNSDYDVQYFPYGSVVYISEADVWLYTQDWQQISKYMWNLIKYVRHNGMTVIFDVQVFDRLPIQLRKLCTDLIYIYDSNYEPARFFGLIKQRTHWRYCWSKPQQLTATGELKKYGADIDIKKSAIKGGLTYKGKIYEQYDSFSGEMYFLNGIEKHGYTVKTHPQKTYTPSGVAEYCAALPLATVSDE